MKISTPKKQAFLKAVSFFLQWLSPLTLKNFNSYFQREIFWEDRDFNSKNNPYLSGSNPEGTDIFVYALI